jgi:hypothetical protein
MYVRNIYNYFHDFRRPVEYATMEINIVIENGQSLKLHQMHQFDVSLSSAASAKPNKNKGYPAYQWAAGRVRSG